MNISNVNIVFRANLSVVAFYDIGTPNAIPDTARYFLYKSGVPKFVKVVIGATGELIITSNVPEPEDVVPTIHTGIEDIWNTSFEIIVGTGDLRPTKTINVNRHLLGGNGIILSSPASGQLSIYQL